jgi:hypothetical protein
MPYGDCVIVLVICTVSVVHCRSLASGGGHVTGYVPYMYIKIRLNLTFNQRLSANVFIC